MRYAATLLLIFASASVSGTPPATRETHRFVYTRLDVPNAAATTAFGINEDRDVVGVYADSSGRQHGFRASGDAYTTIDYPGAVLTSARGIGPNGDIVGAYRYASEPAVNSHGFLLTKNGDFRAADYPGHLNTIPQRLLPNGTILGCYHDNDTMTSMHGVLMSTAGNSEVDMMASMTNGATPDLTTIVGSFTDMTAKKGRSFIIVDGNFTPFDYPGAKSTTAWDISPSATIVGVFQDGNDKIHGFAWGDAGFEVIDFPDALETRVFAINARGDLAGSYLGQDKKTHGFVATRALIVPAASMNDRAEP
jgi:uncharacterized membrane protein